MRRGKIATGLVGALVLAVWLVPATVWGQSAEEMAEFERFVAAGQASFQEGRCLEARESFRAAEAIHSHPSLSARIGVCDVRVGACEAGRERYRSLAGQELPESARGPFAELEQEIFECESKGRLRLDCSPGDARVGPEDVGLICGEAGSLAVGVHELTLDHPDYFGQAVTVEIEEDETKRLAVHLAPMVSGGGSSVGRLVGWSAAGAGLVLVATGLVVDAGAPSRQEEIRDLAEVGELSQSMALEEQAQRRRRQAGGLMLAGAVVGLSGGVVVWRSGGDDENGSEDGLAVMVSPGGIGLRGAF